MEMIFLLRDFMQQLGIELVLDYLSLPVINKSLYDIYEESAGREKGKGKR
jgi:hypothetical protein